MADASTRYVVTRDAQAAVEGREIEIVQALGIQWRPGLPHIDCPYPDHGGRSDWRLNKKGRAICTCTGGKTDSVFDIISKVEGLDFDASKIRAMEIVGRSDLIREKSGGTGFQATDAESLLNAPAARRDDALPRLYLAHRLEIEPHDVLMPSTPTVGLKALEYYDAPTGKGKPKKVGAWPCAIFGTIDAEGRRHAHRIYLGAAGAGKADLGRTASGEPRDAKKSAKRVGEESTAGRAVIWGNAAKATSCIIAEGIETGSAVAYAFRAEVEAGDVYVAAGINAGGIEAFTPWPATKRVTVAADRDEAAGISRPAPSRRGERAARVFGIRNRDRIATAIAMAGSPGTGTDWLDVHAAHGTGAVREGILAAVAFEPTAEEVEQERERTEGIASLRRYERDFPLPANDSFKLAYQHTDSGRIKVHAFVKVGDEIVPQPIATPFGVAARTRYADDGDAYGLRLVVEDMGGAPRKIDVDRAAFARQGAAETRAMLFEAGLRTENDGEVIAVKALKAADPQTEIVVFRRPGWHELPGVEDQFFVCPSGKVVGAPADRMPELSVNARIRPAVAVGGTLEGWKAAVEAACTTPRCEHWTIGAIAGFCAPLLWLCGIDSCGINLSGMTSGGKTTAQRLAVSPWSRAALNQRDSLLQSARATANGIELMASRSSGTVLAMDDLGHVHGKEVGKIIYSLSSGVGKNRMTGDAQLRTSHTWSTFIILSAEKSLEEKTRSDGAEWAGGMAVRIPDIDITGVDRAVHHAILDRIKGIDKHFGHAGPAFIEALIAAGLHRKGDELRARVDQTARLIVGGKGDGKHDRAAIPFSVMATAGALAQQFGLLPAVVDIGRAVRWAWEKFAGSTDAVALDPETQAVANLQAWIAERWSSSIQPTAPDDGARLPMRDALGWFDDVAVYIPCHRLVEAAGGSLKEVEVARALDKQGLIAKRHDADCMYVSYVPRIGRVKVYALSKSAFGRASRPEPLFGLHQGGRA